MLIVHGTTAVRTHAEFDPAQGFTGFDTIMRLKEEYRDLIDIQVVAFPQEGIFKAPGTDKMMIEAMEKGADVVGGIPYNDAPANEHIDLIFEIAKRFDKDIDLHQDFADEADDTSIVYLCENHRRRLPRSGISRTFDCAARHGTKSAGRSHRFDGQSPNQCDAVASDRLALRC